jgi:gamma-glutamyltranspeptidase/glutathione hydrolase
LIAFSLELLAESGGEADFGSFEALSQLAQVMALTNQARQDAQNLESDWLQACRLLGSWEFLEPYLRALESHPQFPRGTTHLNVIDKEGNVASMSLSNGEGCGHVLAGTDIMLNNMLGEEDINPTGFEAWPTDVRMSSMMSPTILFQPDGNRVAMGSGGSNRIRTAIVQVLKNLMDYGMEVPDAVEAPRIHFERELLSIEPGFAPEVIALLEKIFPEIHLWEEKNLFFGGVHTVSSHPKMGFSGCGDPRRFGVTRKV